MELSNFLICYIFHLYFDDNYLHERVKCLYETKELRILCNYSTDRNIENTSKENFNIQLLRIPMIECMYYIKSVTYARVKN